MRPTAGLVLVGAVLAVWVSAAQRGALSADSHGAGISRTTATSLLHVAPGSIVRWPGDHLESCGVGGLAWTPLAGACYYAVDLQHTPGPLRLDRRAGGRTEQAQVIVLKNQYPIQRLTLPASQVDLSPADAERVERENREVAALWARGGDRRFDLPLGRPLDPLPQGGRFGARRIINGQSRSPHGGSDYAASEGTPVRAVADGTVVLVADHFFSGNSVFVDHGDGLVSMYFHLSRVDVPSGRQVRRGETVGAVGATGRAKGPHLHFGVRWHRARIDPALLLGDPSAIPTVEGRP